eukprot:TRINITY_DN64857_c0_g1_i1.p1 TRINITY_DN64857_c0_g1~~TRINITY_DN64857_c0_g1_i1.p1  ORF type:complete len:488 (-),score=47.51 TRINITY_DN64857_c0_g1_i1:20-1483(-)
MNAAIGCFIATVLCCIHLHAKQTSELDDLPFDEGCWDATLTRDVCCDTSYGAKGNPACWDNRYYTYDLCCTDWGSFYRSNFEKIMGFSVNGTSYGSGSSCSRPLSSIRSQIDDALAKLETISLEFESAASRIQSAHSTLLFRVQSQGKIPPQMKKVKGMESLFSFFLQSRRTLRDAWDAAHAWKLLYPGCLPRCGSECIRAIKLVAIVGHLEQERFVNTMSGSFDGAHTFTLFMSDSNIGVLRRDIHFVVKAAAAVRNWFASAHSDVRLREEHLTTVFTCGDGAFDDTCWLQDSLTAPIVYWSHQDRARRRSVFGRWNIDHGLLLHVASDVFTRGDRIADIGAGSGHYSNWLNATGRFSSLAFDGTTSISELTDNAIGHLNIVSTLPPWMVSAFDWVLNLEMIEHIPAQFEGTVLANLASMCKKGAIISWSEDAMHQHPNAQKFEYVHDALLRVGLQIDWQATAKLRADTTVAHIQKSVAVYRKISE